MDRLTCIDSSELTDRLKADLSHTGHHPSLTPISMAAHLMEKDRKVQSSQEHILPN